MRKLVPNCPDSVAAEQRKLKRVLSAKGVLLEELKEKPKAVKESSRIVKKIKKVITKIKAPAAKKKERK